MASHALAKVKEELAHAHSMRHRALARVKEKGKEAMERNEGTAIAVVSGGALGLAKAKGVHLPTIKNASPAAVYGAAALAFAYFAKDPRTKRAAQSVADGLLAVAAYEMGQGISPTTSGYGSNIETGNV